MAAEHFEQIMEVKAVVENREVVVVVVRLFCVRVVCEQFTQDIFFLLMSISRIRDPMTGFCASNFDMS